MYGFRDLLETLDLQNLPRKVVHSCTVQSHRSPVSQKEHRPRPFGKSQALPCRLCRGFEVTVSRPSSTRAREKPPAFERWCEDIRGPWVARTHHQQADCAEKVPSKMRRPVLCLPPMPMVQIGFAGPQETLLLIRKSTTCLCPDAHAEGKATPPAQPHQQPHIQVSALNSRGEMAASVPEPVMAPSPNCALAATFCPLWQCERCHVTYFLLFLCRS